jgi:conjugative transfer region protein (TIGR03748 family)
MKLLVCVLGASLGLLTLPVTAADVTQINRYATVAHKPLPAQVSPLKAVQQIHFPQDIKTIGQAVDYWLRYSGFHLIEANKQAGNLKQILSQPLPQVDRNLGPLSIETGLLVLIGQDAFVLKAEPFTREINVQQKGRAS